MEVILLEDVSQPLHFIYKYNRGAINNSLINTSIISLITFFESH